MMTEEPIAGCQDRVDQGQEGTGRMTARIQSFLVSTFMLYTIVFCILDTPIGWEYRREALVFNIKKACHPEDCLPSS